MSAAKRLLVFFSGGVLGAAVGTATAVLWAPQSGTEFRGRIIDRIRQVQLAGAEAKAAKEDELIQKFRQEVEDPDALRDEEAKLRVEAAQAVAAIGLSLNAPGAIAAQETHLRSAEATATASPQSSPTSRPTPVNNPSTPSTPDASS